MPVYIIERTFADQLDLSSEDVEQIDEINADEGVRWLFSFLSADRRRTYCLYEAPSPDAIVAAAQRANVPVDEVVEVSSASPELNGRLEQWAAQMRTHGVTRFAFASTEPSVFTGGWSRQVRGLTASGAPQQADGLWLQTYTLSPAP